MNIKIFDKSLGNLTWSTHRRTQECTKSVNLFFFSNKIQRIRVGRWYCPWRATSNGIHESARGRWCGSASRKMKRCGGETSSTGRVSLHSQNGRCICRLWRHRPHNRSAHTKNLSDTFRPVFQPLLSITCAPSAEKSSLQPLNVG